MGLEGGKLSLEALQRPGDQRLAGKITGIVQQIAGLEIIAAIGHQIVLRDQTGGVLRIQPHGVFVNDNFGINRLEGLRRACHLERADPVGGMDDLALQVRDIDRIEIDDAQRTNPGRRQIKQHRRTKPARANHQDTRIQQAQLPFFADLIEDDMARVAQ